MYGMRCPCIAARGVVLSNDLVTAKKTGQNLKNGRKKLRHELWVGISATEFLRYPLPGTPRPHTPPSCRETMWYKLVSTFSSRRLHWSKSRGRRVPLACSVLCERSLSTSSTAPKTTRFGSRGWRAS